MANSTSNTVSNVDQSTISMQERETRPWLRCQRVTLCGEAGIVIENIGFGGLVVRMDGGRIVNIQMGQWRNEIVAV